MLCNENTTVLYDRVLVSDFPSSVIIIITFVTAIFGLICIHVTLAVEACIQKSSKQLLEQTVMREEAPDYYLGEVR
uniref:Uncharacterized protein n=1 Tax=Panagrolaimus superbus TaxID=310955 RepID=A0A914Z8K8_9BILA